jgi:hypothetical protein
MSAWSNLPNAKHIDRVLASVKEHPETWDAARDAVRHAVRHAARDAAWCAVRHAVRHAAYDAAWSAAWSAVRGATLDAAWSAILALIAYDDCDQYLSMSSEQLRAWALLSEHPAAVLLLPMVVVREQIEQLESA